LLSTGGSGFFFRFDFWAKAAPGASIANTNNRGQKRFRWIITVEIFTLRTK
jgi:hypothetical protein